MEIFAKCQNRLPGHMPGAATLSEQLGDIADSLDGSEMPDVYGAGDHLNNFEIEISTLFGKQSAVFMPSGTMAQQIALRVSCDTPSVRTTAPRCTQLRT